MPRISRRWWFALGAVAIVLVAIQLVPNHIAQNPPVMGEPPWNSAATRDLARRACFDCHSNETQWPAYSKVAPVSWLVVRDVREGRSALNFSEWNRPQKEAREAAEKVREGEMPLKIYTLMHAHARLTTAERDALARGLAVTVGGRAESEGHDER